MNIQTHLHLTTKETPSLSLAAWRAMWSPLTRATAPSAARIESVSEAKPVVTSALHSLTLADQPQATLQAALLAYRTAPE